MLSATTRLSIGRESTGRNSTVGTGIVSVSSSGGMYTSTPRYLARMSPRRASVRSGRNVGFDVRGCGSVAASSAACSSLRREAGTAKYARLAASTPQIPGPHSATSRYSSRIRSFESASSSWRAVAASFTLRIGFRDDERYRFFASCWVMVLAPRSRSRCRHAAATAAPNPRARSTPSASAISAGSMPTCDRNRESSAIMTMRWSTGDTSAREVGRTGPPVRPSATARIIAVSLGQRSRHHRGGGHTANSHTSTATTIPSARRRAFLGFASAMPLDLDTLRRRLQRALGKEFSVGDLLGEGGFAAVFRVREKAANRDVAVKVLDLGQTPSPALAERFVREARTSAQLEHPHIVPIYKVGGYKNQVLYIVMRCLDGPSLRHLLETQQRLSVRDA